MYKSLQKNQGFTLIEITVVAAMIAIMAAIAIPAYQDSIRKSRRTDAQGALVSLSAAMERHNSVNNTYQGAGTTDNNTGAPTIFPSETPIDSKDKYYNLTIETATDISYTLKATPKGAQANNGSLSLDSKGNKAWDKDNNGTIDDSEKGWR